MAPTVFGGRDRMTVGCVAHLKNMDGRHEEIEAADPEWDEDMGSRVNRHRDKAMREGGVSVEGRGAFLAGFLIGYALCVPRYEMPNA